MTHCPTKIPLAAAPGTFGKSDARVGVMLNLDFAEFEVCGELLLCLLLLASIKE
jgi:hypothetical protein